MRVLVTGARGQLGAAIVSEFAKAHEVIAVGREELDITDDAAVLAAVSRMQPQAIVNTAAYNDVDGAEDHPVETLNANAFAVRGLARAARQCHATLVHYGTDFVFDGTASRPYTEDDEPSPAACTRRRNSWVNGSPRTRRHTTCCASKASSAARRAGDRRRGASPAFSTR